MADMMSLGLWQTGDADFQPRATPTGGALNADSATAELPGP
jgi:hypothetical protein